MSSLISYVSMLAESAGPGVIMSPSCPSLSHYYVLGIFFLFVCLYLYAFRPSALTTMLFSLLHVGWMVISFDAFYKKNWPLFGLVVVLHLVASYLVNNNNNRSSSSLIFFSIRQCSMAPASTADAQSHSPSSALSSSPCLRSPT